MRYTAKQKKELIELICNKIADDKLSLRAVLRLDGMPSRDIFYRWLDKSKKMADQYARACEERADGIFDEMLEVSDTPQEGIEIEIDEKGNTKEKRGDMLGHRKLQIETRKWVLSRMNPRKYADYQKIDMDIEQKEIKGITFTE
jgi:hypothetical protein